MTKNAGFKISLLGLIITPVCVVTANAQVKKSQKIKQSNTLSINDYMELAKQKNPLVKSYEIGQEGFASRVDSAEIDLSPVITGSYVNTTDQSRPSQLGTRREAEIYTLGVAKKTITGTTFKLDAQTGEYVNDGVIFQGFDMYSTGAVNLTVQQSLWKDFFGHGTRNIIKRKTAQAQLEQLVFDLEARATRIEIESTYWDYYLAIEDLKLKKSNLERAQKIDKWTSQRVSNGISDRSDLMNARALVALRQVELLAGEEEFKNQEIKFKDNIGLTANDSIPELNVNMADSRPYIAELMKNKNVIKIDAKLKQVEAELKSYVADEVTDQLRPDLNVFGTYSTTSYDRDHQQAVSDMTQDDFPKNSFGVNFSWVFESDAKSSLRNSAQKDATAAKLKAEKKQLDGEKAWSEHVRKYELLKKSVSVLESVAQFQRERALAEQDKLSRGRTVTAQVVIAESDAAEAEINLLKTKTQLRKLEVASLLYINN